MKIIRLPMVKNEKIDDKTRKIEDIFEKNIMKTEYCLLFIYMYF